MYILIGIIWTLLALAVWYPIYERVQFNNPRISNTIIRAILIYLTWPIIVPVYFGCALAITVHSNRNKNQ